MSKERLQSPPTSLQQLIEALKKADFYRDHLSNYHRNRPSLGRIGEALQQMIDEGQGSTVIDKLPVPTLNFSGQLTSETGSGSIDARDRLKIKQIFGSLVAADLGPRLLEKLLQASVAAVSPEQVEAIEGMEETEQMSLAEPGNKSVQKLLVRALQGLAHSFNRLGGRKDSTLTTADSLAVLSDIKDFSILHLDPTLEMVLSAYLEQGRAAELLPLVDYLGAAEFAEFQGFSSDFLIALIEQGHLGDVREFLPSGMTLVSLDERGVSIADAFIEAGQIDQLLAWSPLPHRGNLADLQPDQRRIIRAILNYDRDHENASHLDAICEAFSIADWESLAAINELDSGLFNSLMQVIEPDVLVTYLPDTIGDRDLAAYNYAVVSLLLRLLSAGKVDKVMNKLHFKYAFYLIREQTEPLFEAIFALEDPQHALAVLPEQIKQADLLISIPERRACGLLIRLIKRGQAEAILDRLTGQFDLQERPIFDLFQALHAQGIPLESLAQVVALPILNDETLANLSGLLLQIIKTMIQSDRAREIFEALRGKFDPITNRNIAEIFTQLEQAGIGEEELKGKVKPEALAERTITFSIPPLDSPENLAELIENTGNQTLSQGDLGTGMILASPVDLELGSENPSDREE